MTQQPKFEYIAFGDPEALVVQILKESTQMTALHPKSISTDLIGFDYKVDKWVEIGWQGGSYRYREQMRPRIDIITYAPVREEALDLALTARASLYAYQGSNYVAFNMSYIACQTETDIFKSFDPNTGAIRYIQSLRLVLKSL